MAQKLYSFILYCRCKLKTFSWLFPLTRLSNPQCTPQTLWLQKDECYSRSAGLSPTFPKLFVPYCIVSLLWVICHYSKHVWIFALVHLQQPISHTQYMPILCLHTVILGCLRFVSLYKSYLPTCRGQFALPESTFSKFGKIFIFRNTTEILSVTTVSIYSEKNNTTVKLRLFLWEFTLCYCGIAKIIISDCIIGDIIWRR